MQENFENVLPCLEHLQVNVWSQYLMCVTRGHAVAQLVEVAGSIPDGVIGIFRRRNPSGRTVALGLTQPLTEMSKKAIPVLAWTGPEGSRMLRLPDFKTVGTRRW
jgi:hypothetical protein